MDKSLPENETVSQKKKIPKQMKRKTKNSIDDSNQMLINKLSMNNNNQSKIDDELNNFHSNNNLIDSNDKSQTSSATENDNYNEEMVIDDKEDGSPVDLSQQSTNAYANSPNIHTPKPVRPGSNSAINFSIQSIIGNECKKSAFQPVSLNGEMDLNRVTLKQASSDHQLANLKNDDLSLFALHSAMGNIVNKSASSCLPLNSISSSTTSFSTSSHPSLSSTLSSQSLNNRSPVIVSQPNLKSNLLNFTSVNQLNSLNSNTLISNSPCSSNLPELKIEPPSPSHKLSTVDVTADENSNNESDFCNNEFKLAPTPAQLGKIRNKKSSSSVDNDQQEDEQNTNDKTQNILTKQDENLTNSSPVPITTQSKNNDSSSPNNNQVEDVEMKEKDAMDKVLEEIDFKNKFENLPEFKPEKKLTSDSTPTTPLDQLVPQQFVQTYRKKQRNLTPLQPTPIHPLTSPDTGCLTTGDLNSANAYINRNKFFPGKIFRFHL